jgi:hypothetical protein
MHQRTENLRIAKHGGKPLDARWILAEKIRSDETFDADRSLRAGMCRALSGDARIGFHLHQHRQDVGLIAAAAQAGWNGAAMAVPRRGFGCGRPA